MGTVSCGKDGQRDLKPRYVRPLTMKRLFLKLFSSSCMDKSSGVRGYALSC